MANLLWLWLFLEVYNLICVSTLAHVTHIMAQEINLSIVCFPSLNIFFTVQTSICPNLKESIYSSLYMPWVTLGISLMFSKLIGHSFNFHVRSKYHSFIFDAGFWNFKIASTQSGSFFCFLLTILNILRGFFVLCIDWFFSVLKISKRDYL